MVFGSSPECVRVVGLFRVKLKKSCAKEYGVSTHQIAPRPFPGGMMHGEPLFNWAQPFKEGHSRRDFTLQSGGYRSSSELRSLSILRWTA